MILSFGSPIKKIFDVAHQKTHVAIECIHLKQLRSGRTPLRTNNVQSFAYGVSWRFGINQFDIRSKSQRWLSAGEFFIS